MPRRSASCTLRSTRRPSATLDGDSRQRRSTVAPYTVLLYAALVSGRHRRRVMGPATTDPACVCVRLRPSGRQALEQCQRLGIKGYLQPPRSWKVDFRTGKAANRIVARFLTSDARDFPARDDDDDGAAYDLAVRLWRAAQAGRIAITHDVYLKVYQLGRPDLKTTFDVVIVDESQDCNAVTTDPSVPRRVR